VTIPALTLLFLLFLLAKRWVSYAKVQTQQKFPLLPSNSPPAIVGALYRGNIGKKEITATIFDLAQRGFVSLHIDGDGTLGFSKGASLYTQKATSLRPFEIFLLHQIFGQQDFITQSREVEVGLNSELFSQKIALTLVNIYDATVAEGFFIKSPNTYFMKYKVTGIFLFFIALTALVYGAFTLPSQAFVLFFWVGMIISSLLIIGITPGLPHRTPLGDKILKQWMGFRNYLTAKEPVDTHQTSEFFHYLPYAIVLGCEHEWILRWREQTLVLPEWFTAAEGVYTSEDYDRSLITAIAFMSRHLVAARPPDLA
jgi:uncharacterized membrane protein